MSTSLGTIKSIVTKHPLKTSSAVGAGITAATWGIYTPYAMSKDNKLENFVIDEFKKVVEKSNDSNDLTYNCKIILQKLVKEKKMTRKKAVRVLNSAFATLKNSKETNKSWLSRLDLSKKDKLIQYIDETQNDANDAYKKTKKFMPVILCSVGAAVGAGLGLAGGGLFKLAKSIMAKKASKAPSIKLGR